MSLYLRYNRAGFVLLTVSCFGLSYEDSKEGDRCKVMELNGANGECGYYTECPYAIEQIGNNGQNITYCSVGESTSRSLVCCPTPGHKTGPLGSIFANTVVGKLTTGPLVCVYTGKFPLVCWNRSGLSKDRDFRSQSASDPRCNKGRFTFPACNACYEFSRRSCGLCVSPNVSGGIPAVICEFPHLVMIGYRMMGQDKELNWHGAGSLITTKWILTAAHVINFQSYQEPFALMGTSFKADLKDGIVCKVQPYIYPNSFGGRNHDIGLVKLLQGITLHDKIKPICLPVAEILPVRFPERGIIAGWGKAKETHLKTAKRLLKGEVSLTLCDKSNGTFIWRKSKNICILPSADEIDTCEGDSGGSMIVEFLKEDICGRYALGVVSRGLYCGKSKSYYTNVRNREYLKWIINTIWPTSAAN